MSDLNAEHNDGQQQSGLVPERKHFNSTANLSYWPKILGYVFETGNGTDLILIAREGDKEVRVPVVSTLIALRSDGLARIIDGLSPTATEVLLPDVTPRILSHALHFITVGDLKKGISESNIFGLLDFHQHYPTSDLFNICRSVLKRRLKAPNAIRIWRKAVEYNIADLMEASLRYIFRNSGSILATDDFLNVTTVEFQKLLESDDLNLSEIDIFNSVLRWGTYQFQNNLEGSLQPQPVPNAGQLRGIINPLISLVRFPLMTSEEIAQVVKPSQILNNEERLAIYDYISASDTAKPTISFNTNQRVYRSLVPTTILQNVGVGDQAFDVTATTTPNFIRIIPISNSDTPTQTNIAAPHIGKAEVKYSAVGLGNNVGQTPLSIFHSMTHTFASKQRLTQNSSATVQNANAQAASTPSPDPQRSPEQRERSPSSTTVDSTASFFYDKRDGVYQSWEEFVNNLGDNDEQALDSTFKIRLKNVTLRNNHNYPTVVFKNLKTIILDLNLPYNIGTGGRKAYEREHLRFEKSFDIKRYLFYRKSSLYSNKDIHLEELWDHVQANKMSIKLEINGATMLRMNDNNKEIAIGFRNDSDLILSGVWSGILKLSLMKTDVPNFTRFPCKNLKELLFYHVWALSSTDVKEFVRKCSSLQSFCCWVICPWWENMRKSACNTAPLLHSPTELDMKTDLVSKNLKHLALYKVVLTVPPKTVKTNLTDLFLDTCFWPANFGDNFGTIFPNLRRCALIQRDTHHRVRQDFKSAITIRMVHNLIHLNHIEWIRILGLDWNERYVTEQKATGKLLRSSIIPIDETEVVEVKNILVGCNIHDDAKNFILERNLTTADSQYIWSGLQLNEREPTEYDNGYWDFMDQLDYGYYKLDNFFKSHQTFQNNFVSNLGLP